MARLDARPATMNPLRKRPVCAPPVTRQGFLPGKSAQCPRNFAWCSLPPWPTLSTAVRLSVHVLAATVWVGGQIVVAGLLPTVRSFGADAAKRVARAFGRIQWPAYAVLVVTGVWNVFATRNGQPSAWGTVLGVKIGVVVLAGIAAYLHQRSKSPLWLAAWGALTALASLGRAGTGRVAGRLNIPGAARPCLRADESGGCRTFQALLIAKPSR